MAAPSIVIALMRSLLIRIISKPALSKEDAATVVEVTESTNRELEVAQLKKIAMKTGMKTLHQDSILKAKTGATTMEGALANVQPEMIS